MAAKPSKAMEQLTDKVNWWLRADSPGELAGKLRDRKGGDIGVWKDLVNDGLRNGTWIPDPHSKTGALGYRTRNEEERASSTTRVVSVNRRARQAVAA